MAIHLKIDPQGRLLIPVEVRRKIGLQPESEVKLTLVGNQLVIFPINLDLEEQVRSWRTDLEGMRVSVGKVTFPDRDEQWMDEDYARRKMGIN